METPVNTPRVAGEAFRARNAVPYALAMAAVGVFSFLSGGYVIGRSTPVAVALLCAAAVWVWFLRRSTRPPLLFLVALAVFAAFVVWSGLSVLWSYGPDLTWVAFNLTAFYLAVVTVLGLTSARGLQLRTVGYGYLVVAAAVGTYAFLGKGLPDVVTHAHTYARLSSPIGYWNVLALMMVMGFTVALSVAGDRRTPVWLRTFAAAAAVPMCFAFFFTLSRGGWLALAVALLLYFAFTTIRLLSFFTLVAVVAPLAYALWRLRGLGTLFADTTDDALRTLQGHTLLRWAAVALLVTAAAQLAVALLQGRLRWPRWASVAAGAAVLAVVLVVAVGGSGWFVQAHGGVPWVKDRVHALLTDAESGGGNGAGRLLTLTTNGRIPLWREAARQSRYARAAGTGAGTFSFTHYRFRESGGVVKHAHSQWFNVLSELGVVGLGLFVAAIALLVAALIGNPFARRRDPLHPLLVALQAGVIAFVVHISWDWDWDMAAVGTLAFVFIAVGVSYRATRAGDERRAERAAAREAREGETIAEPAPAGQESVDGPARGEQAERRAEAATVAAPIGDYRVAATGAASAVAEEAGERPERSPAPAGTPVAPTPQDAPAAVAAAPRSPADHVPQPEYSARASGEGAPTPPRRSRRLGWGPRAVASAALLLLAASWLPPYLAQHAQNDALAAAGDGRIAAALGSARRAARLDPLAVSPLLTQAAVLQQMGQNRAALAVLQDAARLQPQNYLVWYALGELQQGALGQAAAARASFTRALALNPLDAASRSELERLAQ